MLPMTRGSIGWKIMTGPLTVLLCATGPALEASLAFPTALQIAQGLAGSKVSFAAAEIDSCPAYPANILVQANTWVASSSTPLAKSQAARSEKPAIRRDIERRIQNS